MKKGKVRAREKREESGKEMTVQKWPIERIWFCFKCWHKEIEAFKTQREISFLLLILRIASYFLFHALHLSACISRTNKLVF